jgi:hypothetical protein
VLSLDFEESIGIFVGPVTFTSQVPSMQAFRLVPSAAAGADGEPTDFLGAPAPDTGSFPEQATPPTMAIARPTVIRTPRMVESL